jgi:hypothetical protein
MKITAKQLKRMLQESSITVVDEPEEDFDFFLHGAEDGEPYDAEGAMSKSQLYRIKKMAFMLCDMLDDGDQLPAWVQDHISVAQENLSQVFSYMEPKYSMSYEDEDWDDEEDFEDFEDDDEY